MTFLKIYSSFLLLLATGVCHAETITFHFSGSVTQVPVDEVFGDIAVGDAIDGSFNFDSTATDLIPGDPATGSYSFGAPFGLSATVGAHPFEATGSLNIGIFNGFVDQYTVLATIRPATSVSSCFFRTIRVAFSATTTYP